MSRKQRKGGEAEQSENAEDKNYPIDEMRVANVRATFWENTGGWPSVTFSRLYLPNGKDKWQSTTSFRRTDMGNLMLLAVKAEQWMANRLDEVESTEKVESTVIES